MNALGGSDIHHLLNIEPYGCKRYLWYDKMGEEPDYPILNTGAIKRGNKLEDIILKEYQEVTGNIVRRVFKTIEHKDLYWAKVHLDGEIIKHTNGPGVLECKSVGQSMYNKIKSEGIPMSWYVQVQHMLFVTGRSWASIAVLWAENWEFLYFDQVRDDVMISAIEKNGNAFWSVVENGPTPERLDPKDKRCGRCPFRTTCQGEALLKSVGDNDDIEHDANITPYINELVELEQVVIEANALITAKKDHIKELIGDRPIVDCDGYRLHYKPVVTNRINTKKLKSEKPEIFDAYATKSISRPFRKYPK